MRRGWGETLLSVVGLLVLVSVLIALDPRVRERVGTVLAGNNPTTTVTSVSGMAGDLGSVLVDSAREQAREHGVLLVFGGAAMVLFTFMLRT